MATVDEFAIPTTILRHFDLADTPWTELTSPLIEDRRKRSPGGRLFFDRLLELTGLDGPSLYPPNTPAALRRLLHSIHSCPFDRLKRDCLLYYLLKDYDAASPSSPLQEPTMDVDGEEDDDMDGTVVITTGGTAKAGKGSSRADGFAKRRCLPRTWRVFMDGYWALDHSLWELAVSSLSDPSITTLNFVPFILNALATHVSPPSHSLSLINSFLISARPELVSVEENDVRLLALASAGSIAQAFGLIRSVDSSDERKRMRENVWCWILGAPKTACGAGEHYVQSKSLRELLHLPLAAEEDKHLVHFLSHPPRSISPPALSLLHDLVTLRLIHQGQYQDSLQLDKQLAGSGGKEEDRQRRREMVREFIAILPEAQRRALLVDVEVQSKRAGEDANKAGDGPASEDFDMSSSWVNVTAPVQATAAVSAPAINTTTNGVNDTTSYADIAAEPPTQPTPAVVAAPTPIRPAIHAALINAASVPLPSSPAPASASTPLADRRPASPFSGPPRFAPGSSTANPSPKRVLSGSPFNLPPASSASSSAVINRSKGSPAPAAPVPKLPRHVINDDDDQEDDENDSVLGTRSKAQPKAKSWLSRAPSKSVEPTFESREVTLGEEASDHADEMMAIDGDHPISPIAEEPPSSSSHPRGRKQAEPPKSVRKSRRGVSDTREKTQSPPPPPPSPPTATRKPRTRRRSSAAPPSNAPPPATPGRVSTNGMPGAFSQANQSEDEREMPPPAPPAARGLPRSRTSAALPDSGKPRSRMTRSVSRAIMDEDGEHHSHANETPGAPPSKKTKSTSTSNSVVRRSSRASLAPSEADEFSGSVRRSTRSRTAGPSEQGSPTPSDAGSVVSTRRRTRSAREGSATPRMSTRTRRG
ncbi:hypothetical protein IAU59_005942 [Kwoniella sp. CBS 9459]